MKCSEPCFKDAGIAVLFHLTRVLRKGLTARSSKHEFHRQYPHRGIGETEKSGYVCNQSK
jgi:hypothetical protein